MELIAAPVPKAAAILELIQENAPAEWQGYTYEQHECREHEQQQRQHDAASAVKCHEIGSTHYYTWWQQEAQGCKQATQNTLLLEEEGN